MAQSIFDFNWNHYDYDVQADEKMDREYHQRSLISDDSLKTRVSIPLVNQGKFIDLFFKTLISIYFARHRAFFRSHNWQ